MSWFALALCSALAVGVHDICKKHALVGNSPLPVLTFSTWCAGVLFAAGVIAAGELGAIINSSWVDYAWVTLRSMLVAVGWSCVYFAMRELPISIASPIRSSSPLWTFVGAIILFRELPTIMQLLAMLLILGGYVAFNLVGGKEGFSFLKSRSVHLMLIGTLFSSAAALLDKFLLGELGINRTMMQFYFYLNLSVIFGVALAWRHVLTKSRPPWTFDWRWSIPAVGILLIVADFMYFRAVGMPGAAIAQVVLLRRTSVIITFFAGSWLFHDKNILMKTVALILIAIGVVLLGLAR